jgi:hypothetical protein
LPPEATEDDFRVALDGAPPELTAEELHQRLTGLCAERAATDAAYGLAPPAQAEVTGAELEQRIRDVCRLEPPAQLHQTAQEPAKAPAATVDPPAAPEVPPRPYKAPEPAAPPEEDWSRGACATCGTRLIGVGDLRRCNRCNRYVDL